MVTRIFWSFNGGTKVPTSKDFFLGGWDLPTYPTLKQRIQLSNWGDPRSENLVQLNIELYAGQKENPENPAALKKRTYDFLLWFQRNFPQDFLEILTTRKVFKKILPKKNSSTSFLGFKISNLTWLQKSKKLTLISELQQFGVQVAGIILANGDSAGKNAVRKVSPIIER